MSVNLYTQTYRGGVVDSNSASRIHLALIERQKINVKYGTPHCLHSLVTLSNGFFDVTMTSITACYQIKRFRRLQCRTIEIKYHKKLTIPCVKSSPLPLRQHYAVNLTTGHLRKHVKFPCFSQHSIFIKCWFVVYQNNQYHLLQRKKHKKIPFCFQNRCYDVINTQ